MIPAHDKGILVKHRRTAFAVGMERVHAAKVFLPFQFAFEIETIEPAGTEKHIEMFTVSDG